MRELDGTSQMLVIGCIEANFLQENMRWKPLAEIYTMQSFAPFLESTVEHRRALPGAWTGAARRS